MPGGRSYSSATSQTTLTADPGSGGISLAVADSTKFAALDGMFPWGATINLSKTDQEVVTVTARPDGTHLTVLRGQDGTTAQAHAIGATVDHAASARDFSQNYRPPDFWNTYGHSYMNVAYGAFYQTGRFDALLRAALDVEPSNWRGLAKDGAKLTYEGAAQGGWARFMQFTNRPQRGAPYAPDGGAYVICFGINDIGGSAGTQTEIRNAYKQALRAVLSRARASVIFENDYLVGTRTTYAGGFGSAGGTSEFSSGSTVHTANVTSASVTMTLPSDYNGETVALQFIANAGAFGGTVTLGGTAGVTGTVSTSGVIASATANHCPVVKRITSLTSANAGQTITATITSLDASGSVLFDCWWLETRYPPPVLVCNVARLTTAGYALYTNTIGDTEVNNLNTDIASVVAEFTDGLVQLVDIDSALNKDATLFFDGLHPNEIGAAKCVDALLRGLDQTVPLDQRYPTLTFNNSSPRAGAMRKTRISGNYYSVEASDVIATLQPPAGNMYAAPFLITEGRDRYVRMATRLAVGGSAAGTIRWGIYDDPLWSCYPQTLIQEATAAGALSVGTAAGIVQSPSSGTGSISLPFDPGLYWLVFKQATAGTGQALDVLVGPDRTCIMPQLDPTTLATVSAPIAYLLTGQGSGALPARFPSGATISDVFPKTALLLQ
jgi:lysophospholipase L1-like esterase